MKLPRQVGALTAIASKDTTRMGLCGVQVTDGEAVATDGKILARTRWIPGEYKDSRTMILAREILTNAVKLTKDDLELGTDTIHAGPASVPLLTMDASYPDTEAVLRDAFLGGTKVILNVDRLLVALKAVKDGTDWNGSKDSDAGRCVTFRIHADNKPITIEPYDQNLEHTQTDVLVMPVVDSRA